jgi:hypothetical protein
MSSSPESRDEAREKALASFMEYFRTNYPGPDTIISRPDWHAPKIFRAVEYALKDAGLVASPSESAPIDLTEYVNAAGIGGNDAPHVVVNKLQKAINESNTPKDSKRG